MDGKAQAAALRRGVLALLLITGGLLLLAAAVPEQAPRAAVPPTDPGPDFNGDGFADLAVGMPSEDVGGVEDAGAVQVIHGSKAGLDGDHPIDAQFWWQGSFEFSDPPTFPEPQDRFGDSLAVGRFNGDRFDDLAIGAPGEDLRTSTREVEDAGQVEVLYGSASGLKAPPWIFTQDSTGVADSVQARDYFGSELAAGDFGGRGPLDDLAIGVPGEDINSQDAAGAINIVYGSFRGLNPRAPSPLLHQSVPGVPGAPEQDGHFGNELVAGDLGRSAEDELAVGVSQADVGAAESAGVVYVLYGSPSRVRGYGTQMWHQGSRGIGGEPEAGDNFGTALAVANFGRGDRADLAIGIPYKSKGGKVLVLYGSAFGLRAVGNRLWSQGSPGIDGLPESSDRFGDALAAGDFTGDGFAELAVGVPNEDIRKRGRDARFAGGVNIIRGSRFGLTTARDEFWSQDTSTSEGAIEGASEFSDSFGQELAAADFGRGAVTDLAIGAPGETQEHLHQFDTSYVGAVNVLYGGAFSTMLRVADNQFWWQANDSLHDSAERGDRFGEHFPQ